MRGEGLRIRYPSWVDTPEKEGTYRYYFDESYEPEKREKVRKELHDKEKAWSSTITKIKAEPNGISLMDMTLRDYFGRKTSVKT